MDWWKSTFKTDDFNIQINIYWTALSNSSFGAVSQRKYFPNKLSYKLTCTELHLVIALLVQFPKESTFQTDKLSYKSTYTELHSVIALGAVSQRKYFPNGQTQLQINIYWTALGNSSFGAVSQRKYFPNGQTQLQINVYWIVHSAENRQECLHPHTGHVWLYVLVNQTNSWLKYLINTSLKLGSWNK